MKVTYISLNEEIRHENCVATIGNFDAIHFGHKVLISETLKKSRKDNLPAALITFNPDPYSLIFNQEVKQLTPINTRISLCEKLGLDEVIVIKFTEELMNLEPIEFVEKILLPLNISALYCGYDFSFGKNALGNINLLSKYLNTHPIEEVCFMDERVSSSSIKEYLRNGEIEYANKLLKREFCIMGKVIKGKQVGRTINYPTANIDYENCQFLPKLGVYIGKCEVEGVDYQAMINIGKNPTFYDDYHISLEVHLIGFNEDIYDKLVTVKFFKFLRSEIKFASVDQLITQLNIDREEVINYFNI